MSIHPLNSILASESYETVEDYRLRLRELIQKICLLGLWRSAFFEHAAFYGETALSIFHALDRWSEDLDFSLLADKANFKLESYLGHVRQELEAWGVTAVVDLSQKKQSTIESAFIKANTLQTLLNLSVPSAKLRGMHRDEISSVKFEIDPHPPCAFDSESRFVLEPIPFSVRVMSLPDLFAGKMHAVLARGWANKVKGRDWYDLIHFVKIGAKLNLRHLEACLKQSGHLEFDVSLNEESFRTILLERIQKIDFSQGKNDVLPFISDSGILQNWSRELFEDFVHGINLY